MNAFENLSSAHDDVDVMLEMERNRLARDLHDNVIQIFAALKLNVQEIKHYINNPHHDLMQLVANIEKNIETGHAAIGRVIEPLKPSLSELNIALSIKHEILMRLEGSNIKVVFGEIDETIMLSEAKRTQLDYIVKEVISNIMLHAHADEVRVAFYQSHLKLRLVIEDNGIGFNDACGFEAIQSHGIDSIQYCVSLMDGTVEFLKSRFSNDTPGFSVSVSLPYIS